MKTRNIVIAALLAVALIAILSYATPAHAQLRPCVWPNTCG